MRQGLAISAAAHVVIAAAVVLFAAPSPFEVEPEAGIQVELVTAEEAARPEEPKPEAKPEPKPEPELNLDLKDQLRTEADPPAAKPQPKPDSRADTKPAPSAGAPDAPQDAPKDAPKDEAKDTPPPAPPPEPPRMPAPEPAAGGGAPPPSAADPQAAEVPPPFAAEMMKQMTSLNRPGEFDDSATEKAKLTPEEIAALRASVQRCWTPPPAAAEAKLQVVIRVSFKRNGALAGEPMLIAVRPGSSKAGPALMRAAQEAVRRCQPYAVLPPAKYQEWRLLDLPFSPEGISGG